jgi:hypothetical protein
MLTGRVREQRRLPAAGRCKSGPEDQERTMRRILCGAAVLLVAAAGRADEEKVPLDKLPTAVVEAIKAKFPKAELVSAEKETDGDETTYEVIIKNGAQELEVSLTPEGKILMVTREIPVRALPKAVIAAIKARYPRAILKSAEEISEDDKITEYEVVIAVGKKQLEVTFDPTGKFIEEEEKDDKD